VVERDDEGQEVVELAVHIEVEDRLSGLDRGARGPEVVVAERLGVRVDRRGHDAGGGGGEVQAGARVPDPIWSDCSGVVDAHEQVEVAEVGAIRR
jgi:hypothetical protein